MVIREDTKKTRDDGTKHKIVSARTLLRPARKVKEHAGEKSVTRIATGPLNGHNIIVAKAPEIKDVTKNGVDETDTATNTGVPRVGTDDHTTNETKETKLVRGDKSPKATTEVRSPIEDEKSCTRRNAISVGVDHTKILIGPLIVGVICVDAVPTKVNAGDGARAKVVGGTLDPKDVEVPTNPGVD